jgi:leucine efflux protein
MSAIQAAFHAIGITDVWQLIAAVFVFLMLPGPGTMCVLSCSARHGVRGGFASMAGLMLGDAVLICLAALGVAALLHANPLLFRGMQYIGAAYLAYLGVRVLMSKTSGGEIAPFSQVADFRRGFLVTLVNPKAIVFYMAFFPLFIDPVTQRGGLTFLIMGMVLSICTACYGSMLVLTGNAVARRLERMRRVKTLANKAMGLFLIGFGIKLTTN